MPFYTCRSDPKLVLPVNYPQNVGAAIKGCLLYYVVHVDCIGALGSCTDKSSIMVVGCSKCM